MWRGTTRYLFGRRGQRKVHGFRQYYRLRMMVPLLSRSAAWATQSMPRARLWADREVFPRIMALLRKARHTVIIQMFIWKDDATGRAMAELLTEIADRGVQVTVHKEAVGDAFELNQDFLSTKRQKRGMWHRFWTHPNIRIAHATHNDHAKVYIIDDRTMLVTGMNIADEYNDSWHDFMVELHTPAAVERYLSRGEFPMPRGPVQLVMNTENGKEMRKALMGLLRSAREGIVLEHCYFSDAAVVDALVESSRKGVEVTVILPEQIDIHQHSNMQTVGRLLSQGSLQHLRVFMYPGILHGKAILVDRERAFLGSANLVPQSLDEIGEVNVLIEGRYSTAVSRLRDIMRADILKSRPLQSLPAFHWVSRFLAWLKL